MTPKPLTQVSVCLDSKSKPLTPEQVITRNKLIANNKAQALIRLQAIYLQIDRLVEEEANKKVASISIRRNTYG